MKKCLVLDLDNTLWGGIVGEEGVSGIQVGLSGQGGSFVAFQQVILDLYNQGVILAINSKNNFDDAMRVFREHPNMVLKEHHFAAVRINWNDKAENIRDIARELNIGLDALVFLDDDHVNRVSVRLAHPEVATPDLPEHPEQYAKFLLDLPYFQKGVITDEDKMRGNLYVTERLRKESEKAFESKEAYLINLGIEVHCFEDDKTCVPRLAQLTEKTNQFNNAKRPMSEQDILQHMTDYRYAVFHISARDRYGDYGVIGFALVHKGPNVWTVESLLISCRALGRGIEEAFVHFIGERARRVGVPNVRVLFTQSERNKPVQEFLAKYYTSSGEYFIANEQPQLPNWITVI
jgi:FkbH-like protein